MGALSFELEQLTRLKPASDPVRAVLKLKPQTSILNLLGTSLERAQEALVQLGVPEDLIEVGSLVRVSPNDRAWSVRTTVGALTRLAQAGGIEYVRPLRVHQAHLNDSVSILHIDPFLSPCKGQGVRVAVLDSGIDVHHPDFTGRIRTDLSKNFTNEGEPTDIGDRNGHGTHVAGIIGGAGSIFRGVAPKVELLICKVFNGALQADESWINNAIDWAISKDAHVINYSGGFRPLLNIPPPWVWSAELLGEEKEFVRAMQAGIACVVSAGNDGHLNALGTISMPATCPDVISVGSVSKDAALSNFTSKGPSHRSSAVPKENNPRALDPNLAASLIIAPEVDLIAPGGADHPTAPCRHEAGIISARLNAPTTIAACDVNTGYTRKSGTSQAAPHVAGLAALIIEACTARGINMGPRRAFVVKSILKRSAVPIAGATPSEQGSGIPSWPNIENLLNQIQAGHIPLEA